jgi:predicted phage terminase large subunit-like protein
VNATAVAERMSTDALYRIFGPLRLPEKYVPVEPTIRQDWFLRHNEFEAFFGGAAGPGKSWGLLMAALQYVDVAGYHSLLLRPELTEFEQQGGLIEVSTKWLAGTDAWWNGTKRQWSFPSGATLRFGYLKTLADLTHYAGGGISFLGFDELTLFIERLYLSMFRLLRQPITGELEDVPVRVRSASNPGNIGHVWVKGRFITPATKDPDAVYVPATVRDNPHLDYETYLQTLSHLHPIDRMRLVSGDWDVTEEGGKFRRQDFEIADPSEIPEPKRRVRYWDLAATEPSASNPDPDWTVGVLYELGRDDKFTVRDVAAIRKPDDDVEELVRQTAVEDGRGTPVYIEQDPGQAGKAQIRNYQRRVLSGFACHSGMTRMKGKPAAKEVRARPVAAAVGNKLVRVDATCSNLRLFLDQCSMFPMDGVHDDCVDALSGAHNAITDRQVGEGRTSVPQGRIPTSAATRRSF